MTSTIKAERRRDESGMMPVRSIEVWERAIWQDTHQGPGLTVAEAMRQELAGWPKGYSGGGMTFWEAGRLVGFIVVNDGRVTATSLDCSKTNAVILPH